MRCDSVVCTQWLVRLVGVGLLLGIVGSNAVAESEAEYITTLGLTRFEQKVSAPDFTVTTITGATLRMSDLKGKVVLLNFWATW